MKQLRRRQPRGVTAGNVSPSGGVAEAFAGLTSHGAFWPGVVTLIFAVSRALYFAAGVRFDSYMNEHLMHFISPELMKTDLIRSLFYLHNQPPGFNLFMGVVFKLFPGNAVTVFHIVYLLMGLTLALSLYLLMSRLGVRVMTAAIATVVFIAAPPVVMFENLLLYTYPVTVMLVLAALMLEGYFRTGRDRYAVLFFAFVAAVVFTRSLFHIIWMIAAVALVIVLRRGSWKRLLLMAALPFVIVMLVYIKNLWLVGSFSSSSWMGMSLAKMTTMRLQIDERIGLVRRGKLSELALVPPFKPVWFYRQYARIPSFTPTGVPVLDLEYYPDVGHNWNNLALFSISKQYGRDALTVLKAHPSVYAGGVLSSFRIFFFPPGDWLHWYAAVDNIGNVPHAEILWNTVMYGRLLSFPGREDIAADQTSFLADIRHIGLFTLLIYLFGSAAGIAYIIREARTGCFPGPFAGVAAFLLMTVIYTALAGNLLENGENERFRFLIDPLMLSLTLACFDRWKRIWRDRNGDVGEAERKPDIVRKKAAQ